MNDIEWGLILNFIFWIVMLPAIVFIGVWLTVALFDALEDARENTRSGSVQDDSPHPSQASEDEQFRKIA